MSDKSDMLSTIVGIVLFCAVLYGFYWVFKTVSYEIFYESMVEETVRELVKEEALNPEL